jgi:hypothetical protein
MLVTTRRDMTAGLRYDSPDEVLRRGEYDRARAAATSGEGRDGIDRAAVDGPFSGLGTSWPTYAEPRRCRAGVADANLEEFPGSRSRGTP